MVSENILITTIVVIYISSSIVYVLTTRFGSPTHTELDKITYENELLEKRIQQKELMDRLNK